MTYIPSQKQWQTVLDRFYSVLPFALQASKEIGMDLNMGECRVNYRGYECGTVHCVGGWYAIGRFKEKVFDGTFSFITYSWGASELARDLGFDEIWSLEHWAHDHKYLWGNPYGQSIFYDERSYDHGNGPAKSLIDVIEHFEYVKAKCAQIEV